MAMLEQRCFSYTDSGMPVETKNPAAVQLGKLRIASMTVEEHRRISAKGGQAGGRARAERLSLAKRKAIARKAAEARWGKKAVTA